MTTLVTRSRLVALAGASFAALALGYGIVRVRAQAVTSPSVYYAGTLLSNGSAVTGTHTFSLALYDSAVSGASPCPETVHAGVDLGASGGRFRLPLNDACANAVKSNPELWVEVKVDSIVIGRSAIGAVPHAMKAAAADTVPWTGVSGTVFTGTGSAFTAARADHDHGTGALVPMIPPGSVIAFAGSTAPPGWLLCDGSAVSRTTYSALFATIGVTHGAGNLDTSFNLPDYRGRFLRGVDASHATAGWRDPGADDRTAMANGGNAGNLVGSIQSSENLSHSHLDAGHGHHTLTGFANFNYNAFGPGSQGFESIYGYGTTQNYFTTADDRVTQSAAASIQATGISESRPVNAYVNYIIKY